MGYSFKDDPLVCVLELSVRSTNLCQQAGINTKSQLLEYYKEHGNFFGICKHGVKTNFDLITLCKKLDPNIKVKSSRTLIDEIESYHVRCLSKILKVRDCKRLISQKILTINDFIHSNKEEYQKEIAFLQSNSPRAWKALKGSNKYRNMELNETSEPLSDAFKIFMQLIPRMHFYILQHRLLLTDGKRDTLDAVGQVLELSRERVRQISNMIIKNMILFFRGDVVCGVHLSKPYALKVLALIPELQQGAFTSPNRFYMWAKHNKLI